MIIILRRDFTKICWACSCTSKVLFGTLNTGFWPEVILNTGRFALTFWGSILVAVPNWGCKEVQSYSTLHLFKGWHFQHLALTGRDFELQSISAFQFASCIQPGTKLINSIQSANFPTLHWEIHPCQSLVCTYFCWQKFFLKPKWSIGSNMPVCVARKRPKLDFSYLWVCKIITVTLCSEEQGNHSHTDQKGVIDRVMKTVGKKYLPAIQFLYISISNFHAFCFWAIPSDLCCWT